MVHIGVQPSLLKKLNELTSVSPLVCSRSLAPLAKNYVLRLLLIEEEVPQGECGVGSCSKKCSGVSRHRFIAISVEVSASTGSVQPEDFHCKSVPTQA